MQIEWFSDRESPSFLTTRLILAIIMLLDCLLIHFLDEFLIFVRFGSSIGLSLSGLRHFDSHLLFLVFLLVDGE